MLFFQVMYSLLLFLPFNRLLCGYDGRTTQVGLLKDIPNIQSPASANTTFT